MYRLVLACTLLVLSGMALSGAMTEQAHAQAANSEPGYCAQFYPNSDCNSIGPATPGAAVPAAEEPEEAAPPPSPPKKKAAKKKKPPETTTAAPAGNPTAAPAARPASASSGAKPAAASGKPPVRGLYQ
ncbi:MAG: hypothetical protein PS018_25315 [bacterium]|nr:hypothetical protein [bacterium]